QAITARRLSGTKPRAAARDPTRSRADSARTLASQAGNGTIDDRAKTSGRAASRHSVRRCRRLAGNKHAGGPAARGRLDRASNFTAGDSFQGNPEGFISEISQGCRVGLQRDTATRWQADALAASAASTN